MENEQKKKNSDARIKANDKYNKANYKNISIRVKPEQAEKIRGSAARHNLSLAQLITKAVTEYDRNHTDNTAESRAEKAESTTTEDTAEQIPEYIKNMIDRSKAYDKDFSEKQKIKRKVERERAKAEYNLID